MEKFLLLLSTALLLLDRSRRVHALHRLGSTSSSRNTLTSRCCLPSQSQEELSALRAARTEGHYMYKTNFRVNYVASGLPAARQKVLLLPGFGVGAFHYERNIDALAPEHRVYSLDLLGQGESWPESAIPAESMWRYSAENWRDQIIDFIERIAQGESVHLVGNSLGGYLAVLVASRRPDLVASLVLMNPTPFWGLLPPQQPFIWDGTLPAPAALLALGSKYFDLMRSPRVVKAMLRQVYADASKADEVLVSRIITSAREGCGHEAFTSILFSPQYSEPFDSLLSGISVPVLQLNGKEDPWITPLWGQRLKRAVPSSQYIEISPCGHCPHHECPEQVNDVLRLWFQVFDEEYVVVERAFRLLCDEMKSASNVGGSGTIACEVVDGSPRTMLERLARAFHRVNQESMY